MGGRSSKLVITPENADTTASAPTEAITQLKSNGENGNGEVIPPIEAVGESNGDCQAAADTTAETIPADGSITDAKQKKPNPINWIQKKISFKKVKTPKKPAATEEKPSEPFAEEAQPVITEENQEEKTESPAETVQVQSEVPKVDQGTAIPEIPEVEQTAEPVVEISPSTEEIQNNVGEEQFVEEEEPKEELEEVKENGNSVSHEEEPAEPERLDVDMNISEKIANLGIDAVESLPNGNGIHLNGDAVDPDNES